MLTNNMKKSNLHLFIVPLVLAILLPIFIEIYLVKDEQKWAKVIKKDNIQINEISPTELKLGIYKEDEIIKIGDKHYLLGYYAYDMIKRYLYCFYMIVILLLIIGNILLNYISRKYWDKMD